MKAGIHGHKAQPGPAIRVRDPVKALLDAPCGRSQEAVGNRSIAHINQEEVDKRLRWPDHIFLRCDKLNDRMVEFRPQSPVRGLLRSAIPIEGLRYIVGQAAHIATPAVAIIHECDEWVDVGSAAPAS